MDGAHRLAGVMVAGALFFAAPEVRGGEREEGAPVENPDDVTVRLEAGSDYVTLGDLVCPRGSCVGRVPRGTLDLVRRRTKDGELVADYSTRIVIESPSVVRIVDPGALHTASWIVLGSGVTILLVGIVVPLLVCRSTETTGLDGRVTLTNPCDGLSDPVKIAWIAGMGAGLTLALVGGIGVTATGAPPRASVRPWQVAAAPALRISLEPFSPRPTDNQARPSYGLGLRAVF